jgi:hypothetical protein
VRPRRCLGVGGPVPVSQASSPGGSGWGVGSGAVPGLGGRCARSVLGAGCAIAARGPVLLDSCWGGACAVRFGRGTVSYIERSTAQS